jgi:hypothetical protein
MDVGIYSHAQLWTASTMAQFDSPDADLVLLSESGNKYHVHQCILAAASPFFRAMFTLPQPKSDALSVIPVSEDQSTLHLLLSLVYPTPDPPMPDLGTLGRVLAAAVKYDFARAVSTLRKLLVSPHFMQTEPLRVFAIATRHDLEDEAKLVSRRTLSINILDEPLSDDLKHITAHSYHRLLDLHRRRVVAAVDLVKWSEEIVYTQCGSSFGVLIPPRWWIEFEKIAKEELRLRPTTEKVFQLGFYARAVHASNCSRCPGSLLDSHKALENLKRQIDALPSTI